MSFFGRSNTPQPPPGQPQYTRVPDGLPSGLRPNARPPQHPTHYNDPSQSLFEKRPYDRKPPPQRAEMSNYSVVGTPNESLALRNCLVVHPSEFQNGAHVLVNGRFPVTICHDTSKSINPGVVAVPASPSGDFITVTLLPSPPHSQAPPFLQSVDLHASFWKKGYVNEVPYNVDEMVQKFLAAYSGLVLAPGGILTVDFKGDKLKLVVASMNVVELPDGGLGGKTQIEMGVLMQRTDVNILKDGDSPMRLKSGAKRAATNAIIAPNFKFEDMGIGGLDDEFGANIPVFPPALVEKLGIQHAFYCMGPPGTGKTLIARQIGKMLNAREPKVVNGPEILNKYLFADAEKEYKEKGDESGLHIIIFDELDAVFKQRGSTNNGTGVGDSVVNQLLSKMDGVDRLNNILVIGMTNRLDMIDEALLRPGRLEVHMEISLPDARGRYQILRIHTAKMRTNKVMDDDVDLEEIAQLTKNYSGAEIEGFIKSATSFALNRHVKVGTLAGISDDVENLRVNRDDFMRALDEIKPAYGVSEEDITDVVKNGIITFDAEIQIFFRKEKLFANQVAKSDRTPRVSVLLHGLPGSGKTTLAATMAAKSDFPFIKIISPNRMVGFSEAQKVAAITKTFQDSYKSPLSVIVVDNIERLLEWTYLGNRFSNAVLQTLLGRRLLVLATSVAWLPSRRFGIHGSIRCPKLRFLLFPTLQQLDVILRDVDFYDTSVREMVKSLPYPRNAAESEASNVPLLVGIKKLLSIIEMGKAGARGCCDQVYAGSRGFERIEHCCSV
ncbi:P-loop containing nucleoside triphosphate hydrolase protein [Pisolithus tinctorius]|nr:P-loop containing nucleoside triphosphate hydrolase protein [Pisolithus tinctorius]